MFILLRHSTGMGMTIHSYSFTDEGAEAHMGMSLARVCTAGEWQRAGAPAYVPSKVECQGRKRWG